MNEKKRPWLLIGTLAALIVVVMILASQKKEVAPRDPAYYAGPMMGKHNSNFYMPDHTLAAPPASYHPYSQKQQADAREAAMRDRL